MHTPQLEKELLYSLPIKVIFAGFQSDTLALARAGWDLSMRQGHSVCTAEYELQLALRHDGAKLYAISHQIRIPHEQLYACMSNRENFHVFVSNQIFHIQAVAPGIQFHCIPMTTGLGFKESFRPVDPFPQERETIDLRDFKFFKVGNPSLKEIVVDPEQVPELLELVLKAQGPTMQEIKRREQSRANTAWVRENMGSTKPAHQVQAQIITLAS